MHRRWLYEGLVTWQKRRCTYRAHQNGVQAERSYHSARRFVWTMGITGVSTWTWLHNFSTCAHACLPYDPPANCSVMAAHVPWWSFWSFCSMIKKTCPMVQMTCCGCCMLQPTVHDWMQCCNHMTSHGHEPSCKSNVLMNWSHFGRAYVELGLSWIYPCRTWVILYLAISNLTYFGYNGYSHVEL